MCIQMLPKYSEIGKFLQVSLVIEIRHRDRRRVTVNYIKDIDVIIFNVRCFQTIDIYMLYIHYTLLHY